MPHYNVVSCLATTVILVSVGNQHDIRTEQFNKMSRLEAVGVTCRSDHIDVLLSFQMKHE